MNMYTGQSALAGTSSQELEDFDGAKFYCPRSFADFNERVRISDKTLDRVLLDGARCIRAFPNMNLR